MEKQGWACLSPIKDKLVVNWNWTEPQNWIGPIIDAKPADNRAHNTHLEKYICICCILKYSPIGANTQRQRLYLACFVEFYCWFLPCFINLGFTWCEPWVGNSPEALFTIWVKYHTAKLGYRHHLFTYLIFVTGATGGAHVKKFWPV